MADEILNRVTNSGIISLNLEELMPEFHVESIDLKEQLWQELILKEKDFRAWIKETDWSVYQGKHVSISCSNDAIIPTWAFMLVASALNPYAQSISALPAANVKRNLILSFIEEMDLVSFEGARVVVKGCSDADIPMDAYTLLVNRLQPVVKSLLFGEPCSTVPIYKKPRN